MSIFKRNQDESEEEYEEEDESPRKRIKNSAFKDLKPENKRKRKEPPKPWGKRERLFVFFVILVTAGVSGVLAIQTRSWKLPGTPRIKIPVLSFSNPFFGQETIIIEGDNKDQVKAQQVTSAFKEKTKNLSGVYGLYVVRFKNGSSYGVNEREVFQAASLIKLPVMVAMYQAEEEGRIDLETKYQLKLKDKIAGSGSLYGKTAGYTLTYRELVRLMGKQSDNTAFSIIRKLVGDEKVEDVMKEAGMSDTSLENNETTAYDIGAFFESLYRDNLVSREASGEILEFLTDTIYEDHLGAGISDGTRIAHKYGREVHVVNDAGIVFSDNPFVIVILSKGVVEKEADSIFPELAKMVYDIETEK